MKQNIPRKSSPYRIGISACLLGLKTRYNGKDKKVSYLARIFPCAKWIPLCPETECGLTTPREPMCILRSRLIGVQSGHDYTNRMNEWARKKLMELAKQKPDGFILKSRSPSCALYDAVHLAGSNEPGQKGIGLFTKKLIRKFPSIPVEDEKRLLTSQRQISFLRAIEKKRTGSV